MPSFHHALEISVYSLLYILPYLSLAVYCFRRHLRFSKAITDLCSVVMCILQVCLVYFSISLSLPPVVSNLACLFLYIVFVLAVVKERLGKVLFVLFVFINVAILVMTVSACMHTFLFSSLGDGCRIWTLVVCILVCHLALTFPLTFYVRKYFTSSLPIQGTAWLYLWSIPAIFFFIGFAHLHFYLSYLHNTALVLYNTGFLIVINLFAFVIYHITITLLSAQCKAHQLAQDNHLLMLRNNQYDNLQHRINEARQAKHDVRHHVLLVRDYLRSGKLQELEAYLDTYTESLPDQQSLIYCQHHATNAVLGYFFQQAQQNKITMDIFVQLPETIGIPETTISVVLGNLLENALEACKSIHDGEKKITVRGKYQMSSVFFEITNTYSGTLHRDKSGGFHSTKDNSRGVRLHSVSQIAEAQGGLLEIDAKNGIFRASVLLPE